MDTFEQFSVLVHLRGRKRVRLQHTGAEPFSLQQNQNQKQEQQRAKARLGGESKLGEGGSSSNSNRNGGNNSDSNSNTKANSHSDGTIQPEPFPKILPIPSHFSYKSVYGFPQNLEQEQVQTSIVVLEPGDVLLIPASWWHMAEAVYEKTSIKKTAPGESENENARKSDLTLSLTVRCDWIADWWLYGAAWQDLLDELHGAGMHWYVPSWHSGAVLPPASTTSNMNSKQQRQKQQQEQQQQHGEPHPQKYRYWNTKSDDPSIDWHLPVTW